MSINRSGTFLTIAAFHSNKYHVLKGLDTNTGSFLVDSLNSPLILLPRGCIDSTRLFRLDFQITLDFSQLQYNFVDGANRADDNLVEHIEQSNSSW